MLKFSWNIEITEENEQRVDHDQTAEWTAKLSGNFKQCFGLWTVAFPTSDN